MTMTGRSKPKVSDTPGVGQYNATQPRPTSAAVRIGSSKARDDIFNLKEKEDQPGPGNYASPDPKPKQCAVIGGRTALKPSTNVPGPGQYS